MVALSDRQMKPSFHRCHYGLVKVSTGILKVEKLSDADRQTANLNINANNKELALAA